ncbi:type I restriction-modification system, M subunit [Actinobacillus pleuropneumoniae]|nr:type I restriction-modification system, M subunit [Actinobacillus pleuropneumoniae]
MPNVPKAKKEGMKIYLLFVQHIIHSLKADGKAAVVLPTGFITDQSKIDKKIREFLVNEKMLAGVVSMPSNIFATTGTNVSILFLDRANQENVVLIDASNLGEKIKEGKNQKTVLSAEEEQRIIDVFNQKKAEEDFSVVVSYANIEAKNYSLSAGQYFDVKTDHIDITAAEFEQKMADFQQNLTALFAESKALESQIQQQMATLKFNAQVVEN